MACDQKKFTELMEQHYAQPDRESDEACRLLALALCYAPEELKRSMHNEMKTIMPPVTHVDGAGNPMYSVQQIAEHFGVSVEEVEKRNRLMQQDHPDLFKSAVEVHRLN